MARNNRNTLASTFDELMLPHMDALYRTALGMTRKTQDADDLVQDTYLRAFKYFNQFEGGTNARAWLFKILMNTFINNYRKKTREPERVSYDDMEEFYLYNRLKDSSMMTGLIDPQEAVMNKMQFEAINDAIDKLPVEYREVVILSDINEFTYLEISEMLEIPIGTVRSRLFRGRKQIQRSIWAFTTENTR